MAHPLKILMVAPQPFFRPRGTPFSVLHRIRALLRLGYRVDLLTYPFGDDPDLPGVTIHRSRRPPFLRDAEIGPSISKIALDVPLYRDTRRFVQSGRYDLLHTHEEAGFWGAWLSRRYGIPHLYDMHSSIPQQFSNFRRFNWKPVVGVFDRLERFALSHSVGIITVYPDLLEHVRSLGFAGPSVLIENTLDLERGVIDPEEVKAFRERLGIGCRPAVVYTGNLEAYQGMELLLEAAVPLREAMPEARIVSVGGTWDQIEKLRKLAEGLGVADSMIFVPMVPPEDVFVYHELADALVTTRTRGTNTPLKIYQYLRSGKPIIATDIHSHRQVLDEQVAELVPPEPDGVARGILAILSDPERASGIARRAGELARDRFTEEAYIRTLGTFMEEVWSSLVDDPVRA